VALVVPTAARAVAFAGQMTASVGVGAVGGLLEQADAASRPVTTIDVLKAVPRRVQNTDYR